MYIKIINCFKSTNCEIKCFCNQSHLFENAINKKDNCFQFKSINSKSRNLTE